MANNILGFQLGATFELDAQVTYTYDDPANGISKGDPVDITGWTITAQAFPPRHNLTTRPVITFVTTLVTPLQGLYLIDQPNVPTANWLKNTKYNLKIIQTKPNNFIYATPTVVIDCREFL